MPNTFLTPSNIQVFSHLILGMSKCENCIKSDGETIELTSRHHKLLYIREGSAQCTVLKNESGEKGTFTVRTSDVCFCSDGGSLSVAPRKGTSYLLFEFRHFGVRADYYSQNSLAISNVYVPPKTPFVLEADVTINDGVAVGLVFGFGGASSWSCASYDIQARLAHVIGEYSPFQKALPLDRCKTRTVYHLKIVLDSNMAMSYYADEDLVGTIYMPDFAGGYMGINSYISNAVFTNIQYAVGTGTKEDMQELRGLKTFTGIWEEDGAVVFAKNAHEGLLYEDRSYIYNEASFPVCPPIEELTVFLPRLIHTEDNSKIHGLFKELDAEINGHTPGYNNAIKSCLSEILLALLRMANPVSNAVITAVDAACISSQVNSDKPLSGGVQIEISDIQLLSSMPTASHKPKVLGLIRADSACAQLPVGDALKIVPGAGLKSGRGETVEIHTQEETGYTIWMYCKDREAPVDIRNFLSTVCIGFSVKSNMQVTLGLSLWDIQNETFINFLIDIPKADVWQKRILPFHSDKIKITTQDYFYKALRYIELHYAERLYASDVAENVHITMPYLSRIFKAETGQTLSGYIIGFRIEKAKLLLAGTNLSINEVAIRVGFYDSSHFYHTFAEREKILPGEYRKSYH